MKMTNTYEAQRSARRARRRWDHCESGVSEQALGLAIERLRNTKGPASTRTRRADNATLRLLPSVNRKSVCSMPSGRWECPRYRRTLSESTTLVQISVDIRGCPACMPRSFASQSSVSGVALFAAPVPSRRVQPPDVGQNTENYHDKTDLQTGTARPG